MNVQLEHRDGHTAQLTVTIPAAETESAKKTAAQRLSKRVRIPGFRPGKAPYNLLVKMVGEEAILEEAVDKLGNEVYRQALEESALNPIAPGSFVDYREVDGQLVLTYLVPKAPDVNLGEYREVRMELEPEPVTDENVTTAMEALRDDLAVVEDVEREARVNDELELELLVTFWHDEDHDDEDHEHDHDHDHDHAEDESHAHAEETDSEGEETAEGEDEESDEHRHGHIHTLIDEEEAKIVVREAGAENDIFPGFSEHLLGLKVGDTKEFSITLPEDYENEMMAGKPIEVELAVKAVRSRTVPAMNDMLAENATNGEVKTLLELRIKMREDLEKAAINAAEAELFDKAVERIIEGAELNYHQVMVDAYIEDIMRGMDNMLQERVGIKLQDYLKMQNMNEQAFRQSQRETAESRLRRDLVLSTLTETEQLSIDNAAIDREIDRISERFGEQAALYRSLLNTPQSRDEVANRLMTERVVRRVVDIVTGKQPPIGPDPEPEPSAAADPAAGEETPKIEIARE